MESYFWNQEPESILSENEATGMDVESPEDDTLDLVDEVDRVMSGMRVD